MGGVGGHVFGLDFAGNIARRGKITQIAGQRGGLLEA